MRFMQTLPMAAVLSLVLGTAFAQPPQRPATIPGSMSHSSPPGGGKANAPANPGNAPFVPPGLRAPSLEPFGYIDFREISGTVPDGYGGFDWTSWSLWDDEQPGSAQFDGPLQAGPNLYSVAAGHAAGVTGLTMRRSDGGLFNIDLMIGIIANCLADGHHFGSCTGDYATMQGFIGGTLVYEYLGPVGDALPVEPFSAALRFEGIDEFRVFNNVAEFLYVDLLVYSLP